ncbi:MAG: hypothetical protein ACLFNU_12530 [Bacteroidales bacterium]
MTDTVRILGIRINDRVKEAGNVQRVLTQFGCSIKTRLGLHEVTDNHCSTSGLIILELTGSKDEQEKFYKELQMIKGISLKSMDL